MPQLERMKEIQVSSFGPATDSPYALQRQNTELYIPQIGLPILLEEICRPILELYKSLTDT